MKSLLTAVVEFFRELDTARRAAAHARSGNYKQAQKQYQ